LRAGRPRGFQKRDGKTGSQTLKSFFFSRSFLVILGMVFWRKEGGKKEEEEEREK